MAAKGLELAVAYVTLTVGASKVADGVKRELGEVEKASARTGQVAGKSLGAGIAGTAGKALKGLAVTGVAAAGAAAAAAFTKGFGRLKAIEEAQAKLRGLGHDAKTVEQVMKSATAAVKGTAYGLGDAATAAASALAAGVKPGRELEQYLKGVGDAATIAGSDFGEMASIFNKVRAGGLIQGEEIAQLSDRGIPILQLLGKELGVSALQVKKLASEGKVGFATFEAAMRKGMGGAALESGKTVQGAFDNLMASLGRVGANLLKPLYDLTPGFLTWVTGMFQPVEAATSAFGQVVTDTLSGVRDRVAQMAGPGMFSGLSSGAAETGAAVDRLKTAFDAVTASPFWGWLKQVASEVAARLAPALAQLGGMLTRELVPSFLKAVAAFAEFAAGVTRSPVFQFLAGVAKTMVLGFVDGVINAVTGMVRVVTGVFDVIAAVLTGDWAAAWAGLKDIVSGAVQAIWGVLNVWLIGRALALVRGFAAGIIKVIAGGLGGVGAFISGMFAGIGQGIAAALASAGGVLAAFANNARQWLTIAGAGFTVLAGIVATAWDALTAGARAAWSVLSSVLGQIGSVVGGALTGAWNALAGAASAAWDALTSAASTAYGVVQPILSGVASFLTGVLSVAFRAFQMVAYNAWELVSTTVYNAGQVLLGIWRLLSDWLGPILGRAFDTFKTTATNAWNNVRNAIGAAWDWIKMNVLDPLHTWYYTTIKIPLIKFEYAMKLAWYNAQQAIKAAWDFILTRVFQPLQAWITNTLIAGFERFKTGATNVWNTVRDALQAGWNWINTRVFTPLRDWITNILVTGFNNFRNNTTRAWNTLRDALSAGWNFINTRVFQPFRDGLGRLRDWFGTVVAGIGQAWDRLRETVAKPVRFVVNDVIRDGLVKAWNAVASKVNIQQFDFKGMSAFASGGRVPGWSPRDTSDNVPAWLTAGEFVTRRASVRKMQRRHPGLLEWINRHGTLPGYAAGGTVGNLDARTGSGLRMWAALIRQLIMGRFGVRDIGGYRPVDPYPDHPSGRALDIMTYRNYGLGDQIAGFLMANTAALRLNYLIWKQRSWNPNRGWKAMSDRGSITQNHYDHIHALFNPVTSGNLNGLNFDITEEVLAAVAAGGGGGVANPLYAAAKKLVDVPLNAAKGLIGKLTGMFGGSDWAQMMQAGAQMPFDWVSKFLHDLIEKVIPKTIFGGDGAGDAYQPGTDAPAYARGGRVLRPKLYDTGGILRPGMTLVENRTGKPETVRTWEQERDLFRYGPGGQPSIVINGIKHDSVPEFADALNFALVRESSRGRYAGVR